MRKHGTPLAIAGALLFCTGSSALAQAGSQPEKYRYLTLDYQKSEPGKAQDYIQLEKEYYKPQHQERVNLGRIISWKLYFVNWPNGDHNEYDFVVLTEYPSFADMDSSYAGVDRRKILGESKYAELGPKTTAARKLLRQDTVAVLLSTESWDKANNRFLQVHFLKSLPGKFNDLLKVQREFYLPENEDRIKAGLAASWATTAVRYPRKFDAPYDSISFNGLASLAEMEKVPPKDLIEKWRKKSDEWMPLLNASRTRYEGELWSLVDQTTPK
jgi:hypothetical protein